MKSNKPILIDVDGVCANFTGKYLDILNSRFGANVSYQDVTGDVRQYAEEFKDNLEDIISSSGFAQTLDLLDGAQEAVNKFLLNGEKVLFVTSPYRDSATWSFDRQRWLEDKFNATRRDVIFATYKAPVDGRCLIDDKSENIVEWVEYPHRTEPYLGILFKQPWNEDFDHELLGKKILHTDDWDLITAVVNYFK